MKNRNKNIQLIRVIAMLFILLCHFFNEFDGKISFLGQVLNVGVFVFLFYQRIYIVTKK